MAGTLTPTPYQTVLDADGVAVSGALIYTYVGGTTTAAATYTTSALSVANTNPIVADSGGRFVAYLPAGGNFKFVYKTAAGATIEEQDNILSVPGAAVNLDIEGTVGEAVTAGQVVYLSSGAETVPLTPGLWYLTDADAAATSTLPQSVGVAVSAIAINTAGTIRLAGTATTASAVVVGSTYYASATAGAITATAPALPRQVGVALTTSTLLLSATTAVSVLPNPISQDVLFVDATYDIGKSGASRPGDFFQSRNATLGGTLGVTGVATLTAAPVFSSATASQAMFTDGSKALVSNAITGTGSVVMSASPTFTGTIGAAAMTLTGALAANGGITVDSTAFIVADTTGNMTCGTATTGLINDQTISSAANFTGTLGVAGLLTVSGAGTNTFSAGSNAMQRLDLTNTTSGTAARSYFGVNAGTTSFYVQAFSQGYTTGGNNIASSALLESNGTAGLSISASNASGAIRFYSGGTTLREIKLTTGQTVMGGNSTALASGYLTIDVSAATYNPLVLNDNSSSNGGTFQVFAIGAGTSIGSITRNSATSAVLYNTSSDARLKHDQGLAVDVSGLRSLQIHDFTWRDDPSGMPDRNVFAQEAHAVYPRGVTPGSSGDDLSRPWMVDKSMYVPDLIVGWQQHDARLAVLEAKLLAAGV